MVLPLYTIHVHEAGGDSVMYVCLPIMLLSIASLIQFVCTDTTLLMTMHSLHYRILSNLSIPKCLLTECQTEYYHGTKTHAVGRDEDLSYYKGFGIRRFTWFVNVNSAGILI